MRGVKQDAGVRVIIAGHGFVQDLRRGQGELAAVRLKGVTDRGHPDAW
jgi:hypothetical protein